MVGHHAVGVELDRREPPHRLLEDPLEGVEVGFLAEDREPTIPAVHAVEAAVLNSKAGGTRHPVVSLQEKRGLSPFRTDPSFRRPRADHSRGSCSGSSGLEQQGGLSPASGPVSLQEKRGLSPFRTMTQ